MSTNGKTIKPVTGNSSLVRPRFSPGLLLRDDDLNQGVDYTRDLSRLLFRSLFGCGVVCGMKVSSEFKCDKLIVTVADGVALDCRGDPIHVPSPQPIPIDPTCGEEIPKCMWVVLRRTGKCCAPRSAACSCDDEETPAVCTRERDGYEIRILQEPPECACGCLKKPTSKEEEQESWANPPVVEAKTKPKKKGTGSRAEAAAYVESEAAPGYTQPETTPDKCWCVDPALPCYEDHYSGKCGCECAGCDCEWVVLARLDDTSTGTNRSWEVDHSVRRFVRPVLMRDPLAWAEAHPKPT